MVNPGVSSGAQMMSLGSGFFLSILLYFLCADCPSLIIAGGGQQWLSFHPSIFFPEIPPRFSGGKCESWFSLPDRLTLLYWFRLDHMDSLNLSWAEGHGALADQPTSCASPQDPQRSSFPPKLCSNREKFKPWLLDSSNMVRPDLWPDPLLRLYF